MLSLLLLVGCSAEFKDDEGTIKRCVSNEGRPTLIFVVGEARVNVSNFGSIATLSFQDACSLMHYTLHSVEDRDYHCETIEFINCEAQNEKS